MAAADLLTVVITTSYVRSHPTLDVLKHLFRGFQHVPELHSCPKLIVCDGYRVQPVAQHKRGIITWQEESAYKQYIDVLQQQCAALFPCSKVHVLPHHHGFAMAVSAALTHVHTKYVLIAQHDYVFERAVPLTDILSTMEECQAIKYVGFLADSNVQYTNRRDNHQRQLSAGLSVLQRWGRLKLPLVPLLYWYDKTHICRSDHYREFVFERHQRRRWGLRNGDFIEDTLGQEQLKDIKINGIGAHGKYGTFLYYNDDGRHRCIRHLNGRRYLTKEQKRLYFVVSWLSQWYTRAIGKVIFQYFIGC